MFKNILYPRNFVSIDSPFNVFNPSVRIVVKSQFLNMSQNKQIPPQSQARFLVISFYKNSLDNLRFVRYNYIVPQLTEIPDSVWEPLHQR